jgi:DNA polymerase-3 subunit beta
MKFVASTTGLIKALQLANGVISSNVVIPILEYFLFEVQQDGKLVITATDLETSIRTQVEVEARENGRMAVPAKLMLDILKSLPEQPVTFTLDADSQSISMVSDNGRYKISGENPEDFPTFPSMDQPTTFEMEASHGARGLVSTLFAVGNDELKPAMAGLLFEVTPDNIRMVSTDGNKLVRYRRLDARANREDHFIVPRKSVNLLKNSLSGVNEPVQVQYNQTNALFEFGNTSLVARLIDERYPDYQAAIPQQVDSTLRIRRTDLLSSLQRISIFANKTTYQVKLKISGSELQLSAQDLDFSNEGYEQLTCDYDGDDMEIAFSGKHLAEMLRILDTEDVTLGLSDYNKPGILRPVADSEQEDILMLIMPIVINT